MDKILTIAIPTVENRKESFNLLYYHLKEQINHYGLKKQVEIIYECDNKEISIGAKRQLLIDRAKGKYIFMPDDDDWVPFFFVKEVTEAIKTDPDCVGYLEECNFYKNSLLSAKKKSVFSKKYPKWMENHDGYDYVRTPFFKSPIKTELCKQVGCKDMRFGEDHDFAIRIYPLLKTEVFINKWMYIYRHKEENHNVKYGIK